jgi:hypothetical protein
MTYGIEQDIQNSVFDEGKEAGIEEYKQLVLNVIDLKIAEYKHYTTATEALNKVLKVLDIKRRSK